jgi:hypothetical protein
VLHYGSGNLPPYVLVVVVVVVLVEGGIVLVGTRKQRRIWRKW